MERRLAAIFAADMVGYSRLMEADEAGTIERMKANRAKLVDPAIVRHNGRIVKLMGDGMLVEFASVVDALQCAVEIQRAMVGREDHLPVEDRVRYRIGINVGDIMIDEGDIFGDGVNIAARLEAMADPGGVCISGTAYDQIKSKVGVGYESLGDVQVKNIQQPVRSYRVLTDPKQAGSFIGAKPGGIGKRSWFLPAVSAVILVAAITGGAWWWATGRLAAAGEPPRDVVSKLLDKPAVAVLPFVNASGDASQDAFSDSLTRNLITTLSGVYGLAVASSSSSFAYKEKAITAKQVADELGVQSILEGSVQQSGDRVRIAAQLVDAGTGRVLWSDRYDRTATDMLAMQDEIVKKVMTVLQVELVEGEAMRAFSSTTVNPEAFEYARRVRSLYLAGTKRDNAEGIRVAGKALELDPDYSRVWVALGWFHYQRAYEGWSEDYAADVAASRAAVNRAIEIDPLMDASYTMASQIALRFDRDFDRAVELSRKGVELNLNNPQAWANLGLSLAYAGAPEEGLRALKQMERLWPRNPPPFQVFFGQALLLAGQLDEAEAAFRDVVDRAEADNWAAQALLGLAVIDIEKGREANARANVRLAIERGPRVSVQLQRANWVFRNEEKLELWLDGLRRVGLPE